MEKEKVSRPRYKGPNNKEREKAPKDTIENSKQSKIVVLEEYYNYDSMRKVPISRGTLEKLIQNGILWARTEPEAIKIGQFLDLNGIARKTWDEWEEKYPIVKEGYRVIMSILSNRRELGLMTRKYEPSSTMFMMTHYDEDWRKNYAWRASLKDKKEEEQKTYFVTMPVISSPIPERKSEENESSVDRSAR